MTTPLVLQIQEAALDSGSSVTDALRKALVACSKLGLTEFGKWIESELNGYNSLEDFPEYRKLYGIPEGYNPHWGWQPIIFKDAKQKTNYSYAPVGMSIAAIEDSLQRATPGGAFSFPYPPEVEQDLRSTVGHGVQFRIRLDASQCANIVHAVRNALLKWTLDLEAQGITGKGLLFTDEDKRKSHAITAQTITNIHVGQVGAFAVNAERSVVQGVVESMATFTNQTLEFVKQAEALLPAANLPAEIQDDARRELENLRGEASAAHPDGGRLRQGLRSLSRILAPAGETLLKLAVDAAVTKILGPG